MSSSTSNANTETYIKRIKERASPSGEILNKIKEAKAHELDNLVIDTEIQKYKKQLDDDGGKRTGNPMTGLFVGKSPDEIQTILKGLTPEDIQKLQLMTTNMDNSQMGVMLQYLKQPDKNTLSVADLFGLMLKMQPQQQPQQPAFTLEGLAALMKAMREDRPAPQPQTDIYKIINDITTPLYATLRLKDKEVYDAKIREVEAKMPPALDEQIKYVKDMAGALGVSGSGRNELDLKLEELRQGREVDMEKLHWEQKKYELEQEADMNKWEQISKILQGPVGDVVKSLGSAGADRVRGGTGKSNSNKTLKTVQTQCPNCNKNIFVDADADTAVCGQCGSVLQKQGVQPPPQTPTRVAEQPQAQPQEPAPPVEEQAETEDTILDSNQPPSEAKETASEEEEKVAVETTEPEKPASQ